MFQQRQNQTLLPLQQQHLVEEFAHPDPFRELVPQKCHSPTSSFAHPARDDWMHGSLKPMELGRPLPERQVPLVQALEQELAPL
jgi:hypothetical protein